MNTSIPVSILSLKGQRVNKIEHHEERQQVLIHCCRDRRRKAIDPITGQAGVVNQYVSREVKDVPFLGHPCVLMIELAQVRTGRNVRRLEYCEFVDKAESKGHI